jgi:hypothetical protein
MEEKAICLGRPSTGHLPTLVSPPTLFLDLLLQISLRTIGMTDGKPKDNLILYSCAKSAPYDPDFLRRLEPRSDGCEFVFLLFFNFLHHFILARQGLEGGRDISFLHVRYGKYQFFLQWVTYIQ